MKADGNAEFLTFFPQWIVIKIAPHPAVHVIGPHEDAAKAQFLDCPASLFHRRGDIVRGDDAGAVHALRRDFAEIVQPVVVSSGDGRR